MNYSIRPQIHSLEIEYERVINKVKIIVIHNTNLHKHRINDIEETKTQKKYLVLVENVKVKIDHDIV